MYKQLIRDLLTKGLHSLILLSAKNVIIDPYYFYLYRDMVASLALLADMTAQAKAIEILISHAHDVS